MLVNLGSLPRPGKGHRLGIASAKMLPAGLPATTGWQLVLPRESLRTFFECSWLAAQMGEDFTGEMEGAGDQNWIWFCPRQIEGFADRISEEPVFPSKDQAIDYALIE